MQILYLRDSWLRFMNAHVEVCPPDERETFSTLQNETLVDLVTSGDVHCERAFQRFKKTGDLHKMCSDLAERL
jgi:hypothetical protein